MTNAEFAELMDTLTAMSRPFTLVSLGEVQAAIRACQHAHAVGPILVPTAYRNGMARLEANEQFLHAVAAFVAALDGMRPEAERP